MEEGLDEADFLEHASGKLLYFFMANAEEVETLQQVGDTFLEVGFGDSTEEAKTHEGMVDGAPVLEAGALWEETYEFMDFVVALGECETSDGDLAFELSEEADKKFEGRGLASAVGTDKSKDLAGVEVKGDVDECLEEPIVFGDLLKADKRGAHGRKIQKGGEAMARILMVWVGGGQRAGCLWLGVIIVDEGVVRRSV